MVARLEHICANPSVDVRLTADIVTGVRQKVRLLGLDPADTTSEELYSALKLRAFATDEALRERLLLSGTTVSQLQKLIAKANTFYKKDTLWLPKPSIMKKLISLVPPKKTLKLLGYRSITSFVKREDPFELYVIAKLTEEPTWHNQFAARLKRLLPKDFEDQPVRAAMLSEKHTQKLRESRHHERQTMLVCEQMGMVVVFADIDISMQGAACLELILLLQALRRLALFGSYQHVLLADCGLDHMNELLELHVPTGLIKIGDIAIDWHVVHRLLSSGPGTRLETDFLITDFRWDELEFQLATIVPLADFWVGSHIYGTVSNGHVLSFHLRDVLVNAIAERKVEQSSSLHLRASLWNELQYRYVAEESMRPHILKQLAGTSIIHDMIG
jgi:hypothetical protein